MDWTVFHFLNDLPMGHPFLADLLEDFSMYSVPLLAIATVALWFAGRPGTRSKWKMASASALVSAAIALATNQVISHLWARPRPSAAHPSAHLWFVPASTDPSFPSDHSAAAFAIAFAVFFISRRVGTAFLVAAAAIAIDRVLLGLHYPGDILAGMVVGLGSAWVMHRFGSRQLGRVVDMLGRVSDPLVRPVWTALDRRRGSRGRLVP